MTSVPATFPLPMAGWRVVLEAAGEPGMIAVRRLADSLLVGHARLEIDGGTLHVAELAVATEHRGYGCGSEAAQLILDGAAAAGFRRVTAWAPPDAGLAVYFWYRMGLSAVPGPGPGGGILFERKLSESSAR